MSPAVAGSSWDHMVSSSRTQSSMMMVVDFMQHLRSISSGLHCVVIVGKDGFSCTTEQLSTAGLAKLTASSGAHLSQGNARRRRRRRSREGEHGTVNRDS
jgi:hypothetical protein